MYAVVKAGGKQHKVAVGDVVEVNRLEGDAGEAVNLPALLLVDGRTVVSEATALAKISVTGEIVGHHKGPKIKILKYKNKTGYRKRIGHRQLLTELLVTDIDDGTPKKKKKAKEEPAKSAKADADEKPAKAAPAKAAPAKAAPAKAATAEPTKATATADTDEKPARATKASAKAAPAKATAKADSDDKPAKTPAKAPAKTAKATKATKSAKATSAKASDTDEKKKD